MGQLTIKFMVATTGSSQGHINIYPISKNFYGSRENFLVFVEIPLEFHFNFNVVKNHKTITIFFKV